MNLTAIIKKWFCHHEWELMYERKVEEWDVLGCNKYIARYYVCDMWTLIPSFDEIFEANKDVLERIKGKGD